MRSDALEAREGEMAAACPPAMLDISDPNTSSPCIECRVLGEKTGAFLDRLGLEGVRGLGEGHGEEAEGGQRPPVGTSRIHRTTRGVVGDDTLA